MPVVLVVQMVRMLAQTERDVGSSPTWCYTFPWVVCFKRIRLIYFQKIGGLVKYVKDKENICLTADQARYICKKVEQESIVNIEIIRQEIEDERLNKDDTDNKEEVNPYCNIIINEFDRENVIASQMEQWSILSNVVNYVQYDPRDLDVKVIDQKNQRKIYDRLKEEDRQNRIRFWWHSG